MSIREKMRELGLTLPEVPEFLQELLPTVRAGNLVFVSGQFPFDGDGLQYQGRVGAEVNLEQAREAARTALMNCLRVLWGEIDPDDVERVVTLTGYVASAPDFQERPQVIDGASDLLRELFGESGDPRQDVIGVGTLTHNAPVKIEMVCQVRNPR